MQARWSYALRTFGDVQLESDVASLALRPSGAKSDLASALMESQGGRNVVAAGLEDDVQFAAQVDHFTEVGIASGNPPVVRAIGRRHEQDSVGQVSPICKTPRGDTIPLTELAFRASRRT